MSTYPELYRYIAEPFLAGDRLPCFELALRFVYDRTDLGTPTLPKLATEAVRKFCGGEELQHMGFAWRDGARVWVWSDRGEFIGSIKVRLRVETRLEVVPATIQREVA